MAGTPDIDDAMLLDRIAHELFPDLQGTPHEEQVRGLVAAEVSRWHDAPVKDYVPIFVERRLRRYDLPAPTSGRADISAARP
jgi:hypothetical protein